MGFKGNQYIWKDRKRYLGLPLSFTRYAISDDRLFLSQGLLNIKDEEILLYRVRDLSLSRTLGQRMFGVGTIVVTSSDKSQPILQIKNIKDPTTVKELIHTQVEEMKVRRRVRFNEISSISDDSVDDADLDDDLDDDTEDDSFQ